MRKILALCLISLCLMGCARGTPKEKELTKNGWTVELCFEKDDYKIYRFSDGNDQWRYYVVPAGQVLQDIKRSSGKTSSSVPSDIPTFDK